MTPSTSSPLPAGMLTLFADERSSASLRVLCVLAHKRLPFTLHPVKLLEGEHRGEAHAARNPAQAVPALQVGEGPAARVLTQSLAISDWLEAVCPRPPLLPIDPFERARVLAVCQLVAADIHPLTNLRVREEVARLKGDEASRGWVKRWTATGLAALERTLAASAGAHCFGDALTLADFFVAPQAFNAGRAGLLLDPYPIVSRVYANALAQPAFAPLARWAVPAPPA